MNQGGSSIKVTSTAVKGQMKGLLKGLRYISQMFDEEDEEKEIQIGFPTDVKHLAHIGCEDAKANAPSWMTEFKETQQPQPSPGAPVNSTKIPDGQDSGNNSDTNSKSGDGKRSHVRRSRHRSSESQSSMNNNSPTREGSNEGSTKPTRRHHSSESSRRNNRHSTEEEDNKPPTTTKHSHRRKSKTTTTTTTSSEEKENSTRKPSRTRRSSKADSLTDISFTDLGPGPGSGPAAQ